MLRRVLLVLALAALAGGLAGCGAAVKSTVDPVADAATKSQQAGGFKSTIAITLASDGKQYTMTAHGTFGQQQGELDMDLSSLLRQSGMTSGLDGNLRALYLTENGDPVMYLKLGLLSAMIPGGKPWVKLDLAKAGKAAGVDLSQLMGGAGQSPTDSLQLLRSQGDFSQVGTETVGGVSTSHYHGTIDLAKAATARGASADLIKRLRDLGAPAEYPADVWIDDSGYIRRFGRVTSRPRA